MTIVSTERLNSQSLVDAYLATLPNRDPDDTSEIVFESGRFTYKLVNDWAKLPPEIELHNVAGLATDADDCVYVFNRDEHPVLIFDREGNLLDRWGKGVFANPHGIFVGPDRMVYLADDGDHTVRKCTPDGRILFTLGTARKPAPFMSGTPFCRCTDVALSPQGEIYVSDGYGNARIHRYSPAGKLLSSWGEPGNAPGQFNVAHNVLCDDEGWVYVTDRENHRVQVFDRDGRYETQWNNMHRPMATDCARAGEKLFYVGEGGPSGMYGHMPNCGPSVLILDANGDRLAKLGTLPSGFGADRFFACHGLAVDSRGDIYVGDTVGSAWRSSHPGEEPPALFPLRKLIKVAG